MPHQPDRPDTANASPRTPAAAKKAGPKANPASTSASSRQRVERQGERGGDVLGAELVRRAHVHEHGLAVGDPACRGAGVDGFRGHSSAFPQK